VLYHFPSEPIVLKDLRRSALDELRWRLRVPVIRQFGAASVELFAVIVRCTTCTHVSAGIRGVAANTFETSWGQLVDYFRADETWSERGAIPEACTACEAKTIQPVSAFFAKYLPAKRMDFQAEFIFRNRRVHNTRLFLMDTSGAVTPVSREELAPGQLPPLSIRAAWRRLIADHIFSDSVASLEVESGYEIGVRPYADSAWDIHGLNTQLEDVVAQREAQGFDLFALLREVDELDLKIPKIDLFLTWLGAYAADIYEGGIEPFIFIRSDKFLSVLEVEANRLGLTTERVGSDAELKVILGRDGLFVEVNLAAVLLKTIHSGLSFSDGIIEFFGRELSGIRAGVEAIPLIREALPMLSVSVKNGTELFLTDQHGQHVSSVDAIAFATEYNLRQRDEFTVGFGQLAPNHRPKAVTLSPHVAGQLSRVVRRI
jgi:hypothetical protein